MEKSKTEIMLEIEAITELTHYKNGAGNDVVEAIVNSRQAASINSICIENKLNGDAVEIGDGKYQFIMNLTNIFG